MDPFLLFVPQTSQAPKKSREGLYLTIYCSEVAACIGCHKYKQIHEALEKVWSRADSQGYLAATKRCNVISEEERVAALFRTHKGLADTLHSAENAAQQVQDKPNLPALVAEVQQAGGELFPTSAESTLVNKHIQSSIFTTYGTRAEETIVDMLQANGMPITTDTSLKKAVQGQVVINDVTHDWKLAGRVDGFSDNGATVIEIKNRMRDLFHTPPLYELIQIRAYCEILQLQQGRLIEAMTDEDGTRINIVDVPRDELFWKQEVLPKLQTFMQVLVQLLISTEKQDKLLMSKRKAYLVHSWLTVI